jgi:hypothetical protein
MDGMMKRAAKNYYKLSEKKQLYYFYNISMYNKFTEDELIKLCNDPNQTFKHEFKWIKISDSTVLLFYNNIKKHTNNYQGIYELRTYNPEAGYQSSSHISREIALVHINRILRFKKIKKLISRCQENT